VFGKLRRGKQGEEEEGKQGDGDGAEERYEEVAGKHEGAAEIHGDEGKHEGVRNCPVR